MNIEEFTSGCNKQIEDARDRLYKPKQVHWTELNDIDLRANCSPPRHQGRIGSCTAFAATSMFDFVRRKHSMVTWQPSPLFTYYATRLPVSPILADTGASVRDALKSTARDGVSMERIWPYVIDNYNERPPEEAWIVAEKHQTLQYLKLNDFYKDDWLNCLNDGYPFIFGLNLYTSFFDPIFKLLGGYMQDPDRENEKLVGAHCMMAVGYIKNYNEKEYLIVQNSWGTNWGHGGYCYIPLSYIMSNDSFDFWTIRLTETSNEYDSDPIPSPTPTPSTSKPAPTPTPSPSQEVVKPTPTPEIISPVVKDVVVKEIPNTTKKITLSITVAIITAIAIWIIFF